MLSYAGRNRSTTNLLRTIYFDRPGWTPCSVSLMPATWMKYREDLEELVLAHPRIFPGFEKGRKDFDAVSDPLYEPGRRLDRWGCAWENVERGLSSYVASHPLADWDAFESWTPPDPIKDDFLGPRRDWEEVRADLRRAKERGGLAAAGPLPHGFMYMRLYYLRGFENFMMDLATDDPRVGRLIAVVRDYNVAVVGRCLELGAEYVHFGDDLGLQEALPMSPKMWRRFIKPAYEAILGQCRDRGVPVYLHTDGHVLEIIPDLIEVGVRVLNPQIGANGVQGLREAALGKVAMDVDLDRQSFPFFSPSEVEDHIREVHHGLHLPQGGLMLHAECEPDVPLKNIQAICRTLEEVCGPPEPGED